MEENIESNLNKKEWHKTPRYTVKTNLTPTHIIMNLWFE